MSSLAPSAGRRCVARAPDPLTLVNAARSPAMTLSMRRKSPR